MRGADRTERSVREACVQEAMTIIAERGLDSLSLRDVARRLGVSHQAPYKHFPTRDHLVAEVVSRAYADFASFLDARDRHPDPAADLAEMGRRYLRYARERPLHYALMFSHRLPDPDAHPEMGRHAAHAFSQLEACIHRMSVSPVEGGVLVGRGLDALFVWATMHGLAGISAHVLGDRIVPGASRQAGPRHVLRRIGLALGHYSEAGSESLD
ncbi:MAG: TetR/AcrR family transcriptional regulator [Candidatus Limnocylindria bacterium]